MSAVDVIDLRRLSDAWRAKASAIQDDFGKQNPAVIDLVTQAIETCAQDLDALAQGGPFLGAKPQPKAQPLQAS